MKIKYQLKKNVMCIKDASESTFGPDDISKEGTM